MQGPTSNDISQAQHGPFKAVDYRAVPDATIYAPEDGKITAYGDSGTCGNRLELTVGNNRHGFCHLERALVSVGQQVKRGQRIGIMGYTGYTVPPGPLGRHLHHVIYRNGKYIYPPSLINEQFIKEGSSVEVFKDTNDVRVNGWGLFGYDKPGNAPEVLVWVGKPKLEFFKGLGPQVNNDITALRKRISELEQNGDSLAQKAIIALKEALK